MAALPPPQPWRVPRDEARRIGALAAAIVSLGVSSIVALAVVAVPGRPIPTDEVAAAVERQMEGRAEAELPTKARAQPAVATETAPPEAARTQPPAPAPPAPAVPMRRGTIPVGKGMWIWMPEAAEGGNVDIVVTRAREIGLTHIYVRTGSSRMGFYAQEYLNRLLPAAHAQGIRVYGWDFPYLENWSFDVMRALEAIQYVTPDGHRIDGFSADIETRREGVNLTAESAFEYGRHLRRWVGPAYPLIATVPRPNERLVSYPWAHVLSSFDAVAPMVYWLDRDPGADVVAAVQFLSQFGKPVMPVGQAYDATREGGPPGVPGRAALHRFMEQAEASGSVAVSFWSWQHANQETWDAIRDSPWFQLPEGEGASMPAPAIRRYQTLLQWLGFGGAVSGTWTPETMSALAAYQREARLPATGAVDAATRKMLLTPFAPPLQRPQ